VSRQRGGWSSDPPESIDSGILSQQGASRAGGGSAGSDGVLVGEARNIDRTVEQGGLNFQRQFQVLTFRVDSRDSAGNLQQSVPVRLRGQQILGNLKEGERVEVRGRPGRGGVVRVRSFWNLATQSEVTGGGLFIPPGAGRSRRRGAGPSQTGTPRRRSSANAQAPRAAAVGQFIVLTGAVVFTASVTLLTDYVNNGTGGKSLLHATSGDPASPLYPHDFRILIGLVALVFVAAVVSIRLYNRLLMIGAAIASLVLIWYTVHIPSKGSFPGFGPYGSSYWLSLAAAVAITLGAGVAAARSDAA
jgi:hypothetical protein